MLRIAPIAAIASGQSQPLSGMESGNSRICPAGDADDFEPPFAGAVSRRLIVGSIGQNIT